MRSTARLILFRRVPQSVCMRWHVNHQVSFLIKTSICEQIEYSDNPDEDLSQLKFGMFYFLLFFVIVADGVFIKIVLYEH